MTNIYNDYAEDEKQRLIEELQGGCAEYTLNLNACKWLFPTLQKSIATQLREYAKRDFRFIINIINRDEISLLQHMALFFAFRCQATERQGDSDRVTFSVPDGTSPNDHNAIYTKVSRFLFLFMQNPNYSRKNSIHNRIVFNRIPEKFRKYTRNQNSLYLSDRGGFGKTGMPLIPFDASVYRLLHENIIDYIGDDNNSDSWINIRNAKEKTYADNSTLQGKYVFLREVVIREICKSYKKDFTALAKGAKSKRSPYYGKAGMLSRLDEANVLTYILFGAAFWGIYNPEDGVVTRQMRCDLLEEISFINLYEHCASYSLGILQLIENSIGYTKGGFLCLRFLQRNDSWLNSFLKKDSLIEFLYISVSDIAKHDNGKYRNIVEVFVKNLEARRGEPNVDEVLDSAGKGQITVDDLFFPKEDSVVLNYLRHPENTGYHYGLQIFASAVEGTHGDFYVSSGNLNDDCIFSQLSQNTEAEDIRDMYSPSNPQNNQYYCGTKYDILLPISGAISSDILTEKHFPDELSFGAVNDDKVKVIMPCFSKAYKMINDKLEELKTKHGFWEEYLFSKFKKNWANSFEEAVLAALDTTSNVECRYNPLQIFFSENSNKGLNRSISIEMLAKTVFSLLSSADFPFVNIALFGFYDEEGMVEFIRYYAQFYDRFGINRSKAQSSQIMLATCGKENASHIILSGKYIGRPLYEYQDFSGGRNEDNSESDFLRLSLQKIGIRTKGIIKSNEAVNNPHYFDEIEIYVNGAKQKRWMADLHNTINTDFSKHSLFGTRIKTSVTHMHISNVHIDTFYQTEQVFSNAYWSVKIGKWLASLIPHDDESIILFGYERLSEPMLINAQKALVERKKCCEYMIYDGGYHYTAEDVSSPTIGYSLHRNEVLSKITTGAKVVFVMPISTTLATFDRMAERLKNEPGMEGHHLNNIMFVAVFQTKEADHDPESAEIRKKYISKVNSFNNTLLKEGYMIKSEYGVETKECAYLLCLETKWQDPDKCVHCYPELGTEQYERMLYTTDDTSLVPTMMLQAFSQKSIQHVPNPEPLDFFKKNSDSNYAYADCLLYGHIERQDSHFSHYIKMENLLSQIISDGSFIKKASEIRNIIQEQVSNTRFSNPICVIVAPSHISNQRFPSIINDAVFDGKAHIISLNVRKIYRSNFEAAFSNYTYLIRLIKDRIEKSKIVLSDCVRFYFVDDHINTSQTFTRTKSLLKSFLCSDLAVESKIYEHIEFSGIITLVDRHSYTSHVDYIKNPSNFFSFFRFNTPAVRNSGDACHLCKQVATDKELELYAALDSTAALCTQRRIAHEVKEVSRAANIVDMKPENKPEHKEELAQRHMRRFEAEHLIWEKLKRAEGHYTENRSSDDYLTFLLNEIKECVREKLDSTDDKLEYLIAFAKVMPSPFLSYKPFVAITYETFASRSLNFFNDAISQAYKTKTKESSIKKTLKMAQEDYYGTQ